MRSAATLAAACLLGGAGCGAEPAVEPPEIHYGQDVCAVCGMIVSDERYAAALVTTDDHGRPAGRVYDDVGCLLADQAALGDAAVLGRWVRGFDDGRWWDAGAAVYLRSEALHSPMAYGLAAFGTEAEARRRLADFPGEILEYPDLHQLGPVGP